MDMSPEAPFTPLFTDQPMTMDADLDIQLSNWPQDDWAPRLAPDSFLTWSPPGIEVSHSVIDESTTWSPLGTREHPLSLDDNRWRAALQSDKPSSTDWNLNSFPASQPEQISGPAYTNQLTNGWPVSMEPSDLLLDYEDQPGATNSNEIAFCSSIQIPSAESSSSASDNNNDCVAITTPIVHYQSPGDGIDLLNLANKDYLVNLPQSVLKQLSNDVAEALKITKEKEQQKSRESREKAAERLRQGKMLQKPPMAFRCEHPGCNTTFRRNNERSRHIRMKHTPTTKVFFCPVVDCPMGLRHKFYRKDKFHEHLRGKKISSYPWACILPGCPEIAPNKVGLIKHFAQHDYQTRRQIWGLLEDYGFNALRMDSLLIEYNCNVEGCGFGAHFESGLSKHMSLVHDSPPRSCPVPNCESAFEN